MGETRKSVLTDVWLVRSPMLIEMMLACYWSPDVREHFGKRWNSDMMQEAYEALVEAGLVHMTPPEPTPRGLKWVEAILATPLPAAS